MMLMMAKMAPLAFAAIDAVNPPEFIDANSALATSLSSMPAHQAGDILIGIAFRTGGTTPPSLPGGWTSHFTYGGSSTGTRCAWKIAASSSETSGSWSSANNLLVAVYRNLNPLTPLGANAGVASSFASTYTCPTISLDVADGSSWVMGVGFSSSGTTSFEAPSGMSLRFAGSRCGLSDTDAGVTGWSSQSAGYGTSGSTTAGFSIELLAA